MKDSLFENRLARNCFTAAGLDFEHHAATLANMVDDESSIDNITCDKCRRYGKIHA